MYIKLVSIVIIGLSVSGCFGSNTFKQVAIDKQEKVLRDCAIRGGIFIQGYNFDKSENKANPFIACMGKPQIFQ